MDMVEVKTTELIGLALDWAVEQIEQTGNFTSHFTGFGSNWTLTHKTASPFSRCWYFGGPLIEKHEVEIMRAGGSVLAKLYDRTNAAGCGGTALIAACRAIVAYQLGDTVQVPKELMP